MYQVLFFICFPLQSYSSLAYDLGLHCGEEVM